MKFALEITPVTARRGVLGQQPYHVNDAEELAPVVPDMPNLRGRLGVEDAQLRVALLPVCHRNYLHRDYQQSALVRLFYYTPLSSGQTGSNLWVGIRAYGDSYSHLKVNAATTSSTTAHANKSSKLPPSMPVGLSALRSASESAAAGKICAIHWMTAGQ